MQDRATTAPIGVAAQRPSVAEVMTANGGAGPGFDWVRIGLSLCVIALHSFHVSYGFHPEAPSVPAWITPIFGAILPMFFGLSGFLVAGSALRTRNLRVFLTFRVLRIIPALLTEVTLSALVLGTLMTVTPLGEYFSDPRFWRYFGNIVGWIHFELPGVFLSNPRSGIVNQNLWTLHPELLSYALMALLMLSGLVYDRRKVTWLWLAATLVAAAYNGWTGDLDPNGTFPSKSLIYFFLSGVVLSHWRDRIPVDGRLALVSVVAAYGLYWLPQGMILIQIPLMYLMLWLGMQHFPRINWLQRGDYSYGLYLYAYPVQQTVAALLPWSHEWYLNMAISVPVTLIIAMVSWHVVEKPALRLKRFVHGHPRPIASTTEPA